MHVEMTGLATILLVEFYVGLLSKINVLQNVFFFVYDLLRKDHKRACLNLFTNTSKNSIFGLVWLTEETGS